MSAQPGTAPHTAAPAAPPPIPSDLRYVDDSRPGIRRKRERQRFVYFDPRGARIKDADEIKRLNSLAVPPAYTDVWICPDPRGHIQATARDARGRKQYRYHPRWREVRDADKYGRLLRFGHALPRIRARVLKHMALPGMPREKILATIVQLLDVTLIRVGNEEYARSNKSFGLTTMRTRHVEVHGERVCFRFRGKSGIEHDVKISDARIARIIRRCLELPGQELFQYIDEAGEARSIDSADVNDYLREITGGDFTAKDYRTWAGSACALDRLRHLPHASKTEATRNIVATVREVAKVLGNTPAVCRRCYVHPAVLQAYHEQRMPEGAAPTRRRLRSEEARLLAFLETAQTAKRARVKNGGKAKGDNEKSA